MSYIDAQNEFSDAQAVTATAISTNVIDLGATNTLKDIGSGEDIYLVVQTEAACTDVGSDATLQVDLLSDSTSDLATSPTTHWTSGSLAFAAFSPAGTKIAAVKLPKGDYERYLGVKYTVGAGPLTAGAFDAFLTKDVESFRSYAKGYSQASGS